MKPLLRDLQEIADLAANYRQLVINSEAKRDYAAAEDFHIGEMEMRRRQAGLRSSFGYRLGQWMNEFAIYRLLSD